MTFSWIKPYLVKAVSYNQKRPSLLLIASKETGIRWFLLGIGRFSNHDSHLAIRPICLLKFTLISEVPIMDLIGTLIEKKKRFFKLWVSTIKKKWHTPKLLKSMINFEPIDQYQLLGCIRWLVSQENLRFLLRSEHSMLNYRAC